MTFLIISNINNYREACRYRVQLKYLMQLPFIILTLLVLTSAAPLWSSGSQHLSPPYGRWSVDSIILKRTNTSSRAATSSSATATSALCVRFELSRASPLLAARRDSRSLMTSATSSASALLVGTTGWRITGPLRRSTRSSAPGMMERRRRRRRRLSWNRTLLMCRLVILEKRRVCLLTPLWSATSNRYLRSHRMRADENLCEFLMCIRFGFSNLTCNRLYFRRVRAR